MGTTDELTTHQRRILALLAKAESTGFEAEAQALYAKAQELMTRYAIDAATLTPSDGLRSPQTLAMPRPAGSGAAALLLVLSAIAAVNRCVLLRRHDDIALVGFDEDVRLASLLATSVQAQMLRGYSRARHARPPQVNGNTFRASYLLGYAAAVQERITVADATTRQRAEAEGHGSALAVLQDRRAQILEHIGPTTRVRRRRVSVRDVDAFDHGQADGRTADLGARRVPHAEPRSLR